METLSSGITITSQGLESEWRSSLKGMETLGYVQAVDSTFQVRMEVFPERDGNVHFVRERFRLRSHTKSEWRSSLKGMETNSAQNDAFCGFCMVRMEVFPERDGNFRPLRQLL